MMWWLLFAAFDARAENVEAEPPLELLQQRAQEHLQQVSGCWQMVGDVDLNMSMGIIGKDVEKHRFSATLNEGEWGDWNHETLADKNTHATMWVEHQGQRFPFSPPMIGNRRGKSAETDSLSAFFNELVARFDSPVEMSWVTRESIDGRETYKLERHTHFPNSKRTLQADTYFNMETLQPVRWVIQAPRGVPDADGSGRTKLLQYFAEIDVDGSGRPTREVLRTVLRHGLFRVNVDQTTKYTKTGNCTLSRP